MAMKRSNVVKRSRSSGSLSAFGFSTLEEMAYASLLRSPGQTGYKLAQSLKKPAANVYKALEALLERGAAMVEDGDPSFYRAVPVAELFDQFEVDLRNRRRIALRRFGTPGPAHDERVYRLGSRGQCLGRGRRMIACANKVVLIDVFPNLLGEISAEISAAAARGVTIAGQIYAPAKLPGTQLSVRSPQDQVLQRWSGDWMNIVVDGEELLISVLERSGQGLHQAIWTKSPYLVWTYHSALYAEILLSRLREQIQSGAEHRKLLRLIADYHKDFALNAPGYKRLAVRT
jgi:sugar-specific transcriptional regulator TrmB